MFAVVLNYLKSIDVVDALRPAHTEHLQKYYKSGHFLVSGPRLPRYGGFILARAKSRAELKQILEEDPFIVEGAADYQILEFEPKWSAPGLDAFLKDWGC